MRPTASRTLCILLRYSAAQSPCARVAIRPASPYLRCELSIHPELDGAVDGGGVGGQAALGLAQHAQDLGAHEVERGGTERLATELAGAARLLAQNLDVLTDDGVQL